MGIENQESKNYTIGRGDLYFAVRDPTTGVLGGERAIGNTTDFSYAVSSTTLKHYGMSQGMRVQDREVPIQADYSAKFTTDDVNPKNIAALLLGDASTVAITSATAVVESFVGIETGLTYQIGISTANPSGLQKVANVVVKKGVTSAVLNTDYTVDLTLGRVTPTPGGLFADGDTMAVTYDRTAVSQSRVSSGSTVVEGALRLIAHNPEGDDIDYYMPDVKLSPNGDFAIKVENDWQKMPFMVSLNTPNGGAAIYADGRAL